MSNGDLMSNALWAAICLAVFVVGIVIGFSVDGQQAKWSKRVSRNLDDLVERLRADVASAQSMQHEAWMSVHDAEEKTKKYKEMWADELQKRLDLAEKLSKYTGGTPSEGTEDVDGEIPAGD